MLFIRFEVGRANAFIFFFLIILSFLMCLQIQMLEDRVMCKRHLCSRYLVHKSQHTCLIQVRDNRYQLLTVEYWYKHVYMCDFCSLLLIDIARWAGSHSFHKRLSHICILQKPDFLMPFINL